MVGPFNWNLIRKTMIVLVIWLGDIFGLYVDIVIEDRFFFRGGKNKSQNAIDRINVSMILGKPIYAEILGSDIDVP